MARVCTVCVHPEIDEIAVAIAGGTPAVVIAETFGLGVDAVGRHKRAHLDPAMVRVAMARRNEASAVSAVNRLEELYERASALMDQAERKGAIVGGAAVLRELRQIVETLAKISGELDERPTVTVNNLMSSPEMIELLSRLMGALAPFPDAQIAVAEAIDVEALEVAT